MKKKTLWILIGCLIVVIIVTVLTFAYVTRDKYVGPRPTPTVQTACICKAWNNGLLVYLDEPATDRLFYISTDGAKVTDAAGKKTDKSNLTEGRLIRFTSDGISNLVDPPTYGVIDGKIQIIADAAPQLYAEGLEEIRRGEEYVEEWLSRIQRAR